MEERYQLTRAERNSIAYHDGREDGKRAGKREGLVKLVLTILELREIRVNRATRARIQGCKNLDQLEHWAARAKRVSTLDELFA